MKNLLAAALLAALAGSGSDRQRAARYFSTRVCIHHSGQHATGPIHCYKQRKSNRNRRHTATDRQRDGRHRQHQNGKIGAVYLGNSARLEKHRSA